MWLVEELYDVREVEDCVVSGTEDVLQLLMTRVDVEARYSRVFWISRLKWRKEMIIVGILLYDNVYCNAVYLVV